MKYLLILPVSLLLLVGCSEQPGGDSETTGTGAQASPAAPSSEKASGGESMLKKAEHDADVAGKDVASAADKAGKDIAKTAEKAEKDVVSASEKAEKDVASAVEGGGKAKESLKEASGFSDTISKTWDSMKGMDFSDKAAFAKKGMDLISAAKDKLSLLNSISSSLPDGMSKMLMDKVGGISGNITNLSGLLGKAGSITSGDWSSYKDQIGSVMGLLGGNFSGLSSLL